MPAKISSAASCKCAVTVRMSLASCTSLGVCPCAGCPALACGSPAPHKQGASCRQNRPAGQLAPCKVRLSCPRIAQTSFKAESNSGLRRHARPVVLGVGGPVSDVSPWSRTLSSFLDR